MAWPADPVTGQIITAAYIKSIVDAIKTWGGTVDAGGNTLENVYVHGREGSQFLSRNIANNGYIQIGRTAAEATMAVAASAGQFAAGAQAGDFVFRSEGARVCLGVGGTETMILEAGGVVKITGMPSANPGAGTKKLWYDPSDGNRVKYAA